MHACSNHEHTSVLNSRVWSLDDLNLSLYCTYLFTTKGQTHVIGAVMTPQKFKELPLATR
ncbi:hypothetical protein M3J09_004362 [Ascochyta lentis]